MSQRGKQVQAIDLRERLGPVLACQPPDKRRADLCKMEWLGIRVTDDGLTIIDEHAKKMEVATAWNNLDGYRDFLVDRLLAKT
jgi:hypothetical protein